MLPVVPVSFVIHFTFLEFLQVPFLPLACLQNPLLALSVGDILHVDRVMIAGVRREERIVAIWWDDWRFPLREERPRKPAQFIADSIPLFFSLIQPRKMEQDRPAMDNHNAYRGNQIVATANIGTTIWMVKLPLTFHARQVISKEDDRWPSSTLSSLGYTSWRFSNDIISSTYWLTNRPTNETQSSKYFSGRSWWVLWTTVVIE